MRQMTKGRQRKAAGLNAIEAELQRLENLRLCELRQAWTDRFEPPLPPLRSRELVQRMLAWEIQAAADSGLSARTAQKLDKIAEGLDSGEQVTVPARQVISSGVVLTREWRGAIHTVVVTDAGVEYEGAQYRSLSDVARTITGTRWSGPRFFGLEQKPTRGSALKRDASLPICKERRGAPHRSAERA